MRNKNVNRVPIFTVKHLYERVNHVQQNQHRYCKVKKRGANHGFLCVRETVCTCMVV